MENLPLISVIVPVYNVEKYLNHCVQSIVDQTYRNLEIILVDDGSPDQCPTMCDAWAAKDSRIKVIHQKNQGGGAARNAGLDIANGNFIGFVDSDDYISPDMYKHLMEQMSSGADIVECGYVDTYDNSAVFAAIPFTVEEYCTTRAMKDHICDTAFRQVIWNKLYRQHTVENIRFPVGTRIDDEFFTYRVIANAKKLIHTTSCLYAYRQQENSVMHQPFSLSRLQAVEAKCQRLALIQERFPELVSLAKVNLFFTCLYLGQMSLLHLDKVGQKAAFEMLNAAQNLHALSAAERKMLSSKQRIWANLGGCYLLLACRIRNVFRLGT